MRKITFSFAKLAGSACALCASVGMESSASAHGRGQESVADSAATRASEPPSRLEVIDDPYLPREEGVDGTTPRAVIVHGPFDSIQVNTDAQGNNVLNDAGNEPSIAISPTDSNRIVIGWRQFDNIASNFRQAGRAYSLNGGATWTNPGPFTPGTFRSDPVLACDSSGTFFYNSLQGNFLTDMFISPDGVNWSNPIPATGGDKVWFNIDRTNGIGDGFIYLAWSTAAGCCEDNIFTRSIDGGLNYMSPIGLPDSPVWGTVAIGTDGALYISGVADANLFRVLKSTNAQNALVIPSFSPPVTVNMGGPLPSFGGPNPGGLLGQVWIAVDHSGGSANNNVYLVSTVNPAGADQADVMFARSTNGGANWSNPVRINTDPPSTNGWQWFTTMSVAPDGRIDVIWNDTRASLQENISELYYAYSYNAGDTWSQNIQISPSYNSHIGWPNQNKMGDYYHTISDNAAVNIAYAATFTGGQDVYFLRAGDCNNNGVHDGLDIANNASADINGNSIPDECEGLTCAADLTNDDVVNVQDLLKVINSWGPCAGCMQDINNDQHVNVQDMLAVINAWGPCP
jgi:hypothetical protein